MERDDSGLTDRELDRMVNQYQDLKKDAIDACPDDEDLFHYIQGDLLKERVDAVQQHLSLCALCQDIVCSFKQFGLNEAVSPLTWPEFVRQAEASDILNDQAPPPDWEQLKARLSNDLKSPPKSRWSRLKEWLFSGQHAFRYSRPLAATGLASLALSSVLLVRWYPSELSKMAYVEAGPVSGANLPGRSQIDFKSESYKDWYHRGHALLRDSQSWILNRVNREKLDEGIRSLEKAKSFAEVAQDDGYVAQCSFYLGKAYLKRHDLAKAREQFEAFRRMNESSVTFTLRKREAEEILRTIQKLENPTK